MAYEILIVDDEPALQRMVGEILTQAGYRTRSASTCAQALEQVKANPPDGVLLDVMLPEGDGFSLLGKLRAVRDFPVLFLSARDEDEARLRGLGLGADDYITKPFLPQELLLRLGAVLRRSTGRNPPHPGWGTPASTGERESSGGRGRKSPLPPRNMPF